MTIASANPTETRLFALRTRFLSLLPQRIADLSDALESRERFEDFARKFHNLAGTAGTYGLMEVSELAAVAEGVCEKASLYDDETVRCLQSLIDAIREGCTRGDQAAPVAIRAGRSASARILCVEDDPDQAEYIAAILRGDGYHVECVAHAAGFERTLAEFTPDLILMDMGLPDITGVDLSRAMRENSAYTTVPIVFLTGEQRANARIEAISVGADDYLTKPVAPDLLRAVIAARLKHSQSLQALIDYDPLTGALNRAGFFRRVETSMHDARRKRKPLALVMLDLDYFKSINDSYGHPTGDHVLQALVAHLKRHLRAGDDVGRYGGEEFVLLLHDITAHDAQKLVARLIHDFAAIPHHAPNGTTFNVTFSGGVAMWEPDSNLQKWKQRADDALYAAKHAGRARVEAA